MILLVRSRENKEAILFGDKKKLKASFYHTTHLIKLFQKL